MNVDTTYSPPAADIDRLRSRALIAGVVGLVLCGLGLLIDRDHFFRAWLVAYLLFLGIGRLVWRGGGMEACPWKVLRRPSGLGRRRRSLRGLGKRGKQGQDGGCRAGRKTGGSIHVRLQSAQSTRIR